MTQAGTPMQGSKQHIWSLCFTVFLSFGILKIVNVEAIRFLKFEILPLAEKRKGKAKTSGDYRLLLYIYLQVEY